MSGLESKKKAVGATVAVVLLAVLAIGIFSVDWSDYMGSDKPGALNHILGDLQAANVMIRYLYISFVGLRAQKLLDRLGVGPERFHFPGFSHLLPLWEEAVAAEDRACDDLRSEGVLLYTLSCQLHDNSKKANATITESINYMLEHYGEKLTLKQIAEKMCVSHYHFSHIFKKSTGYSPYEYLTLVRLNKAKQMLKTSHDSIHDIALSTGFNSEANFINCFKNHNKCTPAKFRNMPF